MNRNELGNLKRLVEEQADKPYIMFCKVQAANLAKLGFCETNPDMTEGDKIATRVTQSGFEASKAEIDITVFDQPKSLFDEAVDDSSSESELKPVSIEYARNFIKTVDKVTKSSLAKVLKVSSEHANTLIDYLVGTGELVVGDRKGQFVVPVDALENERAELGADPAYFENDDESAVESEVVTESTASVLGLTRQKSAGLPQIDSNIPIPTKRKRISNFPDLSVLDVGQSYWLAIDESLKDPKSSIASRVTRFKKDTELNPEGRDFTTLLVDDNDPRGVGVRVWRIS